MPVLLVSEVAMVLEAIKVHTSQYNENIELYGAIADSMNRFLGICDAGDAAIVPKQWMQPILDALESYFIEVGDNDVYRDCCVIAFRFGEVKRGRANPH
jgi:hypothetical protein